MLSLHRTGRTAMPRRTLVSTLAALAAGLSLTACSDDTSKAGAEPVEITMEELLKSGSDLPDLTLGSEDAKVTIIEYASMTCSHCARFQEHVFPDLKKKYIDTGKVRYIFREYPLDPRAFGASMLARCLDDDKALALIDTLLVQQKEWAFVRENPKQALFNVVKQAGFTEESFDKCLTDQKLLDKLSAVQKRAAEVFKVRSTPTVFVNNKKAKNPTLEAIEEALNPILGSE